MSTESRRRLIWAIDKAAAKNFFLLSGWRGVIGNKSDLCARSLTCPNTTTPSQTESEHDGPSP